MSRYVMVAVKRSWVPEWLWLMFVPVVRFQPFRWALTTAVKR